MRDDTASILFFSIGALGGLLSAYIYKGYWNYYKYEQEVRKHSKIIPYLALNIDRYWRCQKLAWKRESVSRNNNSFTIINYQFYKNFIDY